MKIKIDPRVEEILLKEWDPIGIKHIPDATAEYSSYAGQVFGMLYRGANENQIADYLSKIAKEYLGLKPDEQIIASVAKKLIALNISKQS